MDFSLFMALMLVGFLLLALLGMSARQFKFWLLIAIYMFIVGNVVTVYNHYWETSVTITNYELIDLARAVDKYQRLTGVDVTTLEDLFEPLPQKDGTHPFVHNIRWETTGCIADIWGVPYIYDPETRTIKSVGAKWHFLKPKWYQDVYSQSLPQY